jgi:hypothetical protein
MGNRILPIPHFKLLRFHDINLIGHKLRLLQARLEANLAMSSETSQQLTKLLQDQGMISDSKDVAHNNLIELLKQLPYETMSICPHILPQR